MPIVRLPTGYTNRRDTQMEEDDINNPRRVSTFVNTKAMDDYEDEQEVNSYNVKAQMMNMTEPRLSFD